jgi:hypothetical protein
MREVELNFPPPASLWSQMGPFSEILPKKQIYVASNSHPVGGSLRAAVKAIAHSHGVVPCPYTPPITTFGYWSQKIQSRGDSRIIHFVSLQCCCTSISFCTFLSSFF